MHCRIRGLWCWVVVFVRVVLDMIHTDYPTG